MCIHGIDNCSQEMIIAFQDLALIIKMSDPFCEQVKAVHTAGINSVKIEIEEN